MDGEAVSIIATIVVLQFSIEYVPLHILHTGAPRQRLQFSIEYVGDNDSTGNCWCSCYKLSSYNSLLSMSYAKKLREVMARVDDVLTILY